jgi:hypothetical protein
MSDEEAAETEEWIEQVIAAGRTGAQNPTAGLRRQVPDEAAHRHGLGSDRLM